MVAGSVLPWWHLDSEDAAGCSCCPASPRQAPRTGGPVWERNAPRSQDQPVLPASCPAACPHPEEGHLRTARFGVTSLSPVTGGRGVDKGTASAGFSQWGRHRDRGQGEHSAGERGAPLLLFAERELVAGTRGGGAFGGDGSRRKRAGSTPGAGIWVEAESGRSWQRCGPPPGQHSLFLPAPPWKWFSSQLRPARSQGRPEQPLLLPLPHAPPSSWWQPAGRAPSSPFALLWSSRGSFLPVTAPRDLRHPSSSSSLGG